MRIGEQAASRPSKGVKPVPCEEQTDYQPLHLIQEGKVSLYLPQKVPKEVMASLHAPLSTDTPVFYNPAMIFNRDVSVLVLGQLLKKDAHILDGLSATGIRGLRYIKELRQKGRVWFNDRSPKAVTLIKKNIEMNLEKEDCQGLEIEVSTRELSSLLHQEKFDFIDIDPFGSPIGFLDAAMKALRHQGILAITATDPSALCGSYPRTGLRRYGNWVPRNPWTHEAGIRNLISAAVSLGARYDKALVPLLSHSTDYYYRVYFRVLRSRPQANEALAQMGYAVFRNKEPGFQLHRAAALRNPGEEGFNLPKGSQMVGPLWLGRLFDPELLDRLVAALPDHDYLQRFKLIEKQLTLWRSEEGFAPFFHGTDRLGSHLHMSSPSMEAIFRRLEEGGFKTSRTHFDCYGFKTDAPVEAVVEAFKG